MDLLNIIILLLLSVTGIAMGSIGINCYKQSNNTDHSNYKYLIYMLIASVCASIVSIYAGLSHLEIIKIF